MIFIYLMRWIRWWYDQVVFPIMLNPYTYVLLSLWMLIAAIVTYLFFYKTDRARMQYLYKGVGIAIVKSAGYGLFMVTMFIALYDMALSLTAQSDFFKLYKSGAMSLAIRMPWAAVTSDLTAQRIFTVLFLMFSSMLYENFIATCSYQFEDTKVKRVFSVCIALGSILCYLLCMRLGYV